MSELNAHELLATDPTGTPPAKLLRRYVANVRNGTCKATPAMSNKCDRVESEMTCTCERTWFDENALRGVDWDEVTVRLRKWPARWLPDDVGFESGVDVDAMPE